MGYDILLFKSREALTKTTKNSFGKKEVFINQINAIFPDTDWSDSSCGKLHREEKGDIYIDFYIGNNEEDLGEQIMLFDIGGEKAFEAIELLCKKYDWQAFDPQIEEFIDFD